MASGMTAMWLYSGWSKPISTWVPACLKALIAYSHHQNDGYVRALSQPEDNGFGSLASDSFYLDLHGDIGDDFSFDYRVDYTNEHDMPLADSLTVMSPVNLSFFGASPKFGGQPLQLNKEQQPSRSSNLLLNRTPRRGRCHGSRLQFQSWRWYRLMSSLRRTSVISLRTNLQR